MRIPSQQEATLLAATILSGYVASGHGNVNEELLAQSVKKAVLVGHKVSDELFKQAYPILGSE